jgi:predicted transcriptional regulator
MSDPKPMASLTASLLARKGDARPAIRRAYLPMASLGAAREALQDDLGWDMSEEMAPVPNQPDVKLQQERLATSFPTAPQMRGGKEISKASGKTKAAFTLRLDADRHLRLRLAAAAAGRSSQQLVTAALDDYLARQPGLDALADGVKNYEATAR